MPSCLNRSADNWICSIADRDGRVVFSKDTDFILSHLLRGTPAKLLIVATGNISNQDLSTYREEIEALMAQHQQVIPKWVSQAGLRLNGVRGGLRSAQINGIQCQAIS
ncbi:MAG: DUF5615 family PIN-like protein [Cyanobacteriota bacterium]|jgi:predicted nuclease of predicted toxin-antitoxin system